MRFTARPITSAIIPSRRKSRLQSEAKDSIQCGGFAEVGFNEGNGVASKIPACGKENHCEIMSHQTGIKGMRKIIVYWLVPELCHNL